MGSFVTPRDPGIDQLHSRSVSDSALNVIQSTITTLPHSQHSTSSSHSHSRSASSYCVNTAAPNMHSLSKSLPHLNPKRMHFADNAPLQRTTSNDGSIRRHRFVEYITTEIELIATVIHQHLTATYSHSAGTAASSRYHHGLHSVPPSVPSTGSKRWKISNFFQSLLRHFEVTRNALPLDDSSVTASS